jgi:predicted transcriptional regulator
MKSRLQEIKRLAKLPRMRAVDISNKVGISRSLVNYYLRKHNITLKHKTTPSEPNLPK